MVPPLAFLLLQTGNKADPQLKLCPSPPPSRHRLPATHPLLQQQSIKSRASHRQCSTPAPRSPPALQMAVAMAAPAQVQRSSTAKVRPHAGGHSCVLAQGGGPPDLDPASLTLLFLSMLQAFAAKPAARVAARRMNVVAQAAATSVRPAGGSSQSAGVCALLRQQDVAAAVKYSCMRWSGS